MNIFLKKTLFLSLFTIFSVFQVFSQLETTYLMEVGLQTGLNIYGGEVNSFARKSLLVDNFKNAQPDFGAFLRYKFNPRIAVKLSADMTNVASDYRYADGETVKTAALQNNSIIYVDFVGEVNFFDLENNKYKLSSRKISPYLFAGGGYMTRVNTFTIPFGFGVKWKIAPRWNLNAHWTTHLVASDALEGLPEFNNPDPKTANNFMNNDILSGLMVGISFDFFPKPCKCQNTTLKKLMKDKSKTNSQK